MTQTRKQFLKTAIPTKKADSPPITPHLSPPRGMPLSPLPRLSVGRGGFTLAEVVVSLGIMAMVFGGVIWTYVQASYRGEWAGCSMAAQAQAIQQVEQARSAVWDWSIGKNDLTNLTLNGWAYDASTKTCTGYTWATLDLPISGTNSVVATNFVTIRMLYVNGVTNPPIQVQIVKVDTVWPFKMPGRMRYYTNSVATYCGPDNRDASSL